MIPTTPSVRFQHTDVQFTDSHVIWSVNSVDAVFRCWTCEDGILLPHLLPVLLQRRHGKEDALQQQDALRQAAGKTSSTHIATPAWRHAEQTGDGTVTVMVLLLWPTCFFRTTTESLSGMSLVFVVPEIPGEGTNQTREEESEDEDGMKTLQVLQRRESGMPYISLFWGGGGADPRWPSLALSLCHSKHLLHMLTENWSQAISHACIQCVKL